MAYADEIAKANSERYLLVKVGARRHINDQLTYVGTVSGGYKYSFDPTGYVYDTIYRRTTELTYSSTVVDTLDYWYVSGGLIYVNTQFLKSVDFSTFILEHSIFITNGRGERNYKDPLDSSTDDVYWKPILQNNPPVNQSMKNSFYGKITIGSMSLRAIDSDSDFMQFASLKDTFFRCPVDMWVSVNGAIKKVYSGRIAKVNFDETSVSININSSLEQLTDPCLMGDDEDDCYINRTKFTGVFPNDLNKPIPYIINRSSHQYVQAKTFRYDLTLYVRDITYELEESFCHQAVCVDYDNTQPIGTGKNRKWALCRSETGFKTLNFGTVSTVEMLEVSAFPRLPSVHYDTHVGVSFSPLKITTTGSNIEVGDTFKFTYSSTDYFAHVFRNDGAIYATVFTSSGGAWNPGYLNISYPSAITLHTNQAPALKIIGSGGKSWFPLYERDFSVSISTLTSGHKFMEITFVNTLETTLSSGGTSSLSAISPSNAKVYYRATEGTSANTDDIDVLEKIITSSSDITFSNGGSIGECSFSIPLPKETKFGTSLDYIERIVKSGFGFVYYDNSTNDLYYDAIASGTSTEERSDSNVIDGSLKIDFNYKDIVWKINFSNPYNDLIYTNLIEPPSTDSVENNLTKYLHRSTKELDHEHVFLNVTSRKGDIIDILQTRIATYSFKTSSVDLGAKLGEYRKITTTRNLPDSGDKYIFITDLSSDSDQTDIKGVDLGDL